MICHDFYGVVTVTHRMAAFGASVNVLVLAVYSLRV
jgi:hypothetical protein